MSLEEASSSKIGTLTDRILLYCFHYDETSGRYTPTITRILKLGGVATMAALGFFWFAMYRFEQARYGGGAIPPEAGEVPEVGAAVPSDPTDDH